MYVTFLAIHSVLRWLLLVGLVYTIATSLAGRVTQRTYSSVDRTARIVTTAIAHTQLLIGLTLYVSLSPLVQSVLRGAENHSYRALFFSIYHIAMMLAAVVVLSIGSARAKRATPDVAKFRIILIYFSIALGLILLAIPWFRPYFRSL